MNTTFANIAISPTKANRLYWLGRYAERVVMSMHLLRKYANRAIDGDREATYDDFCTRMGIPMVADAETFESEFLYSATTDTSILRYLDFAKHNAMLLRDDLRSETLAYIEMAVNTMASAATEGLTLGKLTSISDNMMAFWGAVEENIRPRCIRNLLNIGRYVEKLDLMIRFDYDAARIADTMDRLASIDRSELSLCDEKDIALLRSRVEEMTYRTDDTLSRLNTLFAA